MVAPQMFSLLSAMALIKLQLFCLPAFSFLALLYDWCWWSCCWVTQWIMFGNQGEPLFVHVGCSIWWSQSSHMEFRWTAGRVLWSHKWLPKRNSETWLRCHYQWKSWPPADNDDLSTGGVSIGRALKARLAWQPHFSMALLCKWHLRSISYCNSDISGLLCVWQQS